MRRTFSWTMLTSELIVWLSCRGAISGNVIKNGVSRITSNAHFFRSILAIGVIFAVSTWACYFQAIYSTAWYLQEVCVNTFLLATLILAVQTLFVLSAERTRAGKSSPFSQSTHYRSLNASRSIQSRSIQSSS